MLSYYNTNTFCFVIIPSKVHLENDQRLKVMNLEILKFDLLIPQFKATINSKMLEMRQGSQQEFIEQQ